MPSTKEKRLRRYRSKCPAKIQQRIDRAMTQRLYLVERGEIVSSSKGVEDAPLESTFVVLGSTGNVYTVKIAREPTCNCPDHVKNNSLCKHILFVLLKVMGLPRDSPLIYQAAWLSTELHDMFECLANRRVGGSHLANQRVRNEYAKMQSGQNVDNDQQQEEEEPEKVARKSLEEDSDCPICFDSMAGNRPEQLTFCRAMCGTNFHAGCIDHWKKSQGGAAATCPNCRQPWEDDAATKRKAGAGDIASPNAEGYANLGRIQGQSPVRDTSTYHYSPYAYYKRRRYR